MINQLQIRCCDCGHKLYITRRLLGIEARVRIPDDTRGKLGLIGALCQLPRFRKNHWHVWVEPEQNDGLALCTAFRKADGVGLDVKELAEGEADGAGIPIQKIKKRGKELKVFCSVK